MSTELNSFIVTAQRFTAPADGIPVTDHSQQMSYGMGMAQRAAQQAAAPATPPPAAMQPIVPVAN